MTYKMNRRAFTLVEVVAMIVLIVIIGLITIPYVISTVNETKEKAYEEQVDKLEKAAYTWSMQNIEELPDIGSSDIKYVLISDLVTSGIISNDDVLSPLDNLEMTGCVAISWSDYYDQYDYKYGTVCN